MSVFRGHSGDPDGQHKIKEPMARLVKRLVWIGSNNLSTTSWVITLAAEAEDLGLTADPRSLVAPPKGGPADSYRYCSSGLNLPTNRKSSFV